MQDRYRLGLPAWAFPGWKDRFFSDRPSRLASYAKVFNTVEGNTTFYRVPDAGTVSRWQRDLDGRDFRFCFKLPREVTHDGRPDLTVLDEFLSVIRPLGPHLGPMLVQFPDSVSPDDLARFAPVFEAVSSAARWVIEVRHAAFFDSPDALDPVLHRYGADRVVFDSRPLFHGDLDHPEVKAARHRKPDVPVIDRTPGGVTMVRLILHPDLQSNGRYIDEWATRAARKLSDGGDVLMMIHCPNNLHCPPLARRFDDALRTRLPALRPLAPWPVPTQQSLLG